jgi:hypothetical protein
MSRNHNLKYRILYANYVFVYIQEYGYVYEKILKIKREYRWDTRDNILTKR